VARQPSQRRRERLQIVALAQFQPTVEATSTQVVDRGLEHAGRTSDLVGQPDRRRPDRREHRDRQDAGNQQRGETPVLGAELIGAGQQVHDDELREHGAAGRPERDARGEADLPPAVHDEALALPRFRFGLRTVHRSITLGF
jgi:hypothetical protein